jgi:membrane-bound lytic murein transglycosylase A
MVNCKTALRLVAFCGAAFFLASCGNLKKPTTPGSGTGTSSQGKTTPPGVVYGTNNVNVRYTSVAFANLPNWQGQEFSQSLLSFKRGCEKLGNKPQWRNVCNLAKTTSNNNAAAKAFFEYHFTPWQITENGNATGTVTGYYEPMMKGDTSQTRQSRFPIYGIPNDFISVPLPSQYQSGRGSVRVQVTGQNSGSISANGQYTADLSRFPITARSRAIKGRVVGNQFVPYYTRAEINAGALNGKAPILGYADDPVELFFLQVQGSGRLQTPKGQFIRLGFADKNEQPYQSIANYMVKKGYLPLKDTNMQGIKAWMQQNPSHLSEVLGQNPSYVFFRVLPDNGAGPIGALGTPLTDGYSTAVDKHHVELGAPMFLTTTHPIKNSRIERLMVAQDTGSAIKGGVRVDFFWGFGDAAGEVAGKMKHPGQVWVLLPNGYHPRYLP